jgi:PDDEXK-like uncharacterized protein DUF3799
MVAARVNGWPEPGGPYDVDEAVYHADRTALSSSGARTLTKYCPAKFAYERDHGRPDTPAFEFGRAYHSLVLGNGATVVEITAKTRGTKAEVDARAAGQIPLITKDYQRAQSMAEQLRAHPIAGPLFARSGRAEQTFVTRDEGTEVTCRARVDWMPDVPAGDRLILVDLKTANDASPVGFAKSMANYGYHQQGAFYREVVAEALALPISPRFVLVAQEKEPPYLITIAEPDDEAIAWGCELNDHALRTYARCTAAREWPGYDHGPTGIAALSLPGWQVAAYEAAAYRRELIGDPA